MLERARFVTTRPPSQWTISVWASLALAALLALAVVLGVAPRSLPAVAGPGDAVALPDLPATQDAPPEAKFRRPLPLSARVAPRDAAPGLPPRPAMASTLLLPPADATQALGQPSFPDAVDAPHALRPDLTLPPGQAPPRA